VKVFERCRTAAVAALAIGGTMAALALPGTVPAAAPAVADDPPLAVGGAQVQPDTGGHFVDEPSPLDDGQAHPEYVLRPTSWDHTDLTYGFVNHTNDLSTTAQESAIEAALASWSSVTPLTFTKVADCGLAFDARTCTTPDIRISWGTGQHSASSYDPAFDGPGGTAAHGFYPPPNGSTAAGDLHFDDAERWTTSGNGVDLQAIALHELGHALGLDHAAAAQCPMRSSTARPIMCSVVIGADRTLAQDDVNGIQRLYGAPANACGGLAVTVDLSEGDHPTNGNDVIQGTADDDVIAGGGGSDVVCGGNGNDRIDLGTGNDRAIGGSGNDVIYGRSGVDRLEGGAGNDRLLSGDSNDTLYGAAGSDTLDGGTGADKLYAGPQTDSCNGRGGRDAQSGCERRAGIESRLG
jgi:Ca2+-binding RTX toxin-like protein